MVYCTVCKLRLTATQIYLHVRKKKRYLDKGSKVAVTHDKIAQEHQFMVESMCITDWAVQVPDAE